MAKWVTISSVDVDAEFDTGSTGSMGRLIARDSGGDIHVVWSTTPSTLSAPWAGLISYWKLGEATGGRIDSVGGRHLINNNGATNDVGIQGNAAKFVRTSNQFLSTQHDPRLTLSKGGDVGSTTQSYTITCWVNLASKTATQNIIFKGSSESTPEYRVFYDSGTDRFVFRIQTTSGTFNVTANTFGSPSITTWYYIVCKFTATTQISISVNNGTADTTVVAGSVNTPLAQFRIGGGTSSSVAFDGLIDEVALYGLALDDADRATLYNSGAGMTLPTSDLGNRRIVRYATSTDDGVTWTDGEGGGAGSYFIVSDTLRGAHHPALVVDSVGKVHVIWEDREDMQLYYRTRNFGGGWNATDTTSLVAAGEAINRPNLIVAPNDSLHIAAWNASASSIYWARSTDGGTTWTVVSSQFTGGISVESKIGLDADSQNNLHIAFIKESSQKASYAKAAFTTPNIWTWGAEDLTSLNDATTTYQRDIEISVTRGDDDVFAVWQAFNAALSSFTGQELFRLRWAKRAGGIGAWSSQQIAVFFTSENRRPMGCATPNDNLGIAFDALNNQSKTGFAMEADNPAAEVFHKPAAFSAIRFVQAPETGSGVMDIFGEEFNTISRLPQIPAHLNPGDTSIPAIFTDSEYATLKFTTLNSRWTIAHVEPGTTNVIGSLKLVRSDALTFHMIYIRTGPGPVLTATREIFYKTSVDGGITWTDGQGGSPGSSFLVYSQAGAFNSLDLTVDDLGNIYVAFIGSVVPISGFLRRQIAGVWQATDATTFVIALTADSLRSVRLFVDKFGNIHWLSHKGSPNPTAVYHAVSTDQGALWTINPAAASLHSTTTLGLSVDRDKDNNLHLVSSVNHPVKTTKRVLSYVKATFTSPATWTWGTQDRTTMEHPDDAEDVSSFAISGDYPSPTNNMDIFWDATNPTTFTPTASLLHGTVINSVLAFSTIQQTLGIANFKRTMYIRGTGFLARDAAGNLYAPTSAVGTLTSPNSLASSVVKLQSGAPTWEGVLPNYGRVGNFIRGGFTYETRPIFASPGDVYGVATGAGTSGDENNQILLMPDIEGFLALPAVEQTIASDTTLFGSLREKDFIVK